MIRTPWVSRCWVFHSNSIFPRNYWPRILEGQFQEVVIIQISRQGIKDSSTFWTTQLVHTGGIQTTCMELAHLGKLKFHCGNSRPTAHFQDGQIFINPIQLGNPPPPGLVFNF
ncbi:hypothetical protein O181_001151 [Austropuccinia psidii MF-1]|uniref:Uncharacterized protein n=1 Tax=Austropuccinia psidii MF-1 TaxID=1389203 RepID=A0A9Q3BAF6_9BASI|nr:hypothetical protein [Austropuccinia psidii MF-1]